MLQWKKVSWGQCKALHHVICGWPTFPSPGCGIHDPLHRRPKFHASPDQKNDWWACLFNLGNLSLAYTVLLFSRFFVFGRTNHCNCQRKVPWRDAAHNVSEGEGVVFEGWAGLMTIWLLVFFLQVDIPRAPALGLLLDSVRCSLSPSLSSFLSPSFPPSFPPSLPLLRKSQ